MEIANIPTLKIGNPNMTSLEEVTNTLKMMMLINNSNIKTMKVIDNSRLAPEFDQ